MWVLNRNKDLLMRGPAGGGYGVAPSEKRVGTVGKSNRWGGREKNKPVIRNDLENQEQKVRTRKIQRKSSGARKKKEKRRETQKKKKRSIRMAAP